MSARKRKPDKDVTPSIDNEPAKLFPSPAINDMSIRMSYMIARGEQGVLTFEPYKSILLPHWRFRTVSIAKDSSRTLKSAFDHYLDMGDFVGADMARKFIQMGMTRAKRYANHKGGRKYDKSERELEKEGKSGQRTELLKSVDHKGQEEKLEASEVFRAVWKECTSDKKYVKLRGEWQEEKKEWNREQKEMKEEDEAEVKLEDVENG